MCRRKLFFGTVALLALVGFTATTVMGQARKRTYRATGMVTVVPQLSARGVNGEVGDAKLDFGVWIEPFERMFKREEVIERALASASLSPMNLDLDSVRDAVVVERSPHAELICIHFDGPDRVQNVAIMRQIINAYVEVCEEKGWANLKQPSAGSAAEPADPSRVVGAKKSGANRVPDPSIATAERLASAVQSRDRIELERTGLHARLEALRSNSASSSGQRLLIEESAAELSAFDAQLKFLNDRVEGLKIASIAATADPQVRKHVTSTDQMKVPAWIRIIELGN